MSEKHKLLLLSVFDFIMEFVDKNKYTPSYDEISEGLQMSIAYVSRLVSELVDIGLLERKIVKTAWSGIRDADLTCLLIDSTEKFGNKVKIIIDEFKKKYFNGVSGKSSESIINSLK